METNNLGSDSSSSAPVLDDGAAVMTRCSRCCLQNSMRILNMILFLFGAGTIVYSLWLQKKWNEGVGELSSSSSLPRPGFILTCVGVGITVCLSTLCGHMLAKCITSSVLLVYIIIMICLLSLEFAVIVAVFFKMDWQAKFTAIIGEGNTEFMRFVMFNVLVCRTVTLIIWAAQMNAAFLGAVLWVVGVEPRTHCKISDVLEIRQSFLVPDSLQCSRETCTVYSRYHHLLPVLSS
ncbi:hypothetical protein Tsubulata_017446 [Turnera subulata]|uniref:Uncharacterized protein n=1 Tax=Turnera subulata TaxID=218843 RepID=A0A9Q0G6X7_9ROSI|nr:hypothetical protein Tsubulata_017446 [Turnera subulata]